GEYLSVEAAQSKGLDPRKRTRHRLIPARAGGANRCWAAFGAMGADGQPQIQSQVFLNMVERGLSPAEAVAEPRLRVRPGGGGLWVEADYSGAGQVARAIAGAELLPARSWQLGHAAALVVDGPARWRAGADPRSDGAVIEV